MATVKPIVISELLLFGKQSKAFLKQNTNRDCEGQVFTEV